MNLANKITITRFLLVPVYMYLMLYTKLLNIAFLIFLLASATDYLDGYIARKYNMITSLGKLIDPLADKFLVIAAFIIFATEFKYIDPITLSICVFREITISVFRAVAASKNIVIAAGFLGKLKTVLQIFSILLIHLYISFKISFIYVNIAVFIMTIITLLSLFDYIFKNKDVLKNN